VSSVLDAGALVAVERGDRDMIALIKAGQLEGRAPITHGAVIGQVWRSGRGRQANLARLLAGVEILAVDDTLGRRAGVLLGKAGGSDVIDASLILLCEDGDEVFTSDPDDLAALASVADLHVDLVPV